MEKPFTNLEVLNNARCMICGRIHHTSVPVNPSMSQMVLNKSDDCYIIYKKLLGIYGAPFIDILNSY
jgi:hypothetical protein